jgi:hypothetical protein
MKRASAPEGTVEVIVSPEWHEDKGNLQRSPLHISAFIAVAVAVCPGGTT